MTAQAAETFIYQGKSFILFTEPLEQFLEGLDAKPMIIALSTTCWNQVTRSPTLSHQSLNIDQTTGLCLVMWWFQNMM